MIVDDDASLLQLRLITMYLDLHLIILIKLSQIRLKLPHIVADNTKNQFPLDKKCYFVTLVLKTSETGSIC